MKYFLIFLTVFLIFGSTACSPNKHNASHTEVKPVQDNEDASNLSIDDQTIIKKYKDTINNLNFREREHANKTMKDILPEIRKIKNDYERQKIEMQIYLATSMYQEAYDLNNKRMEEDPSTQRQFMKCELMKSLNLAQALIKSCHAKLAQDIHKELDNSSKDDPLYIYGEWSYLLAMYQAGHDEYKQKMQDFIAATKDETMKTRFKDSFELATQ